MMDYVDDMLGESSYNHRIHQIRSKQLPNWQDSLHLDASASAPVPRCILDAVHSRMINPDLSISNPHSNSPSGRRTRQEIDNIRSLLCKEIFHVQRKAGRIIDGKGDDSGWELTFNSGSTAGLQLIARSFNFGNSGKFAYLRQSHSSLYGLREIVQNERKNGAADVNVLEEEEMEEWITNAYCSPEGDDFSLLAIPLQCNATGKRFHLLLKRILKLRERLEERIGIRRVFILLDAASYLSPSSRMKLKQSSSHQPDFICFSLIKLLGYPSGVGGLMLQRSSSLILSAKSYFGGGTLEASTSKMQWRKPKGELHESLEDGTLNLFGIIAIPPALNVIRSKEILGSWQEANEHVDQLTKYLWKRLYNLKHSDNSPMCELYSAKPEVWNEDEADSSTPTLSQGSCILFNVLKAAGLNAIDHNVADLRIDPAEVDRLACLDDIHLRSGRMCNVGAITTALNLEEDDIITLWNQGIGCGGSVQTANNIETTNLRFENPEEYARLGALVHGALRVSLSAWNTFSDIDDFVAFLEKYFYVFLEENEVEAEVEDRFVECLEDDLASSVSSFDPINDDEFTLQQRQTSSCGTSVDDHEGHYYLEKVYIYPIKSCAAQRISNQWKLTDSGLEHDRDFCLVDLTSGKVLSQKRLPAMARIRPTVCLEEAHLKIEFYDRAGTQIQSTLTVPLKPEDISGEASETGRQYEMCGTSLKPQLVNDLAVREAFSQFLGIDCTLARSPLGHRTMEGVPLRLSNESPFLMISSESIDQVCQWMKEDSNEDDEVVDSEKVGMAFRANFIISRNSDNREEELSPFYEDRITQLRIGNNPFTVLGPCRRCEMIALDPITGSRCPKVMKAIAKNRRSQSNGPLRGKLLFGQHLIRRQILTEKDKVSSFVKQGMLLRLDIE